ncbi:MAG: WG repeat-containing protein [Ferruginibacter sp.]|nr:WG repeat-containing protein [Ferruginibacter sp.]
MKKIILSFLYLFLISKESISQKNLTNYSTRYMIPYRDMKLWGISDTLGNIIIKPQFDSIGFFENFWSDSFAKIFHKKKTSYIDYNGKIICPFYEELEKFDDDFYRVKDSGKYGLIWLNRKEVIPIIYDTLILANKYPQFQKKSNKVIVRKKDEFYIVSYLNNNLTKIENPEIEKEIIEKRIAKEIESNSKREVIYVDVPSYDFKSDKTIEIANPNYKIYKPKRIDKKDKKYGVLDEEDKIIIDYKYDSIRSVDQNLYIVQRKGKFGAVGFMYYSGLVPLLYNKLEYFKSIGVTNTYYFTLFKVQRKNRIGFVGGNGVEYFKD